MVGRQAGAVAELDGARPRLRRRDRHHEATITVDGDTVVGELAWIVGARHQRRGYAVEAARAMARWLREQGARTLFAEIHPDHHSSMAVARSLGLQAGERVLESGEICWTG